MHAVFINLTIYLFISGYYLSRVFFLTQCFKSCPPLKDKLIVIKFKTGQLFCLHEEKLVGPSAKGQFAERLPVRKQ